METLDINWQPSYPSIFIWIAMDKNEKLAFLFNNNWGNIPKVLLKQTGINEIVNELEDYIYEKSKVHTNYPINENGEMQLDLYSFYQYKSDYSHVEIYQNTLNHYLEFTNKSILDSNVVMNKGLFFYQALEGRWEGEDYPVGYDGKTQRGDYFRHLIPTIFATIDDFPKELRQGIAVSNTLDFSKDRIIFNQDINLHFTATASQ